MRARLSALRSGSRFGTSFSWSRRHRPDADAAPNRTSTPDMARADAAIMPTSASVDDTTATSDHDWIEAGAGSRGTPTDRDEGNRVLATTAAGYSSRRRVKPSNEGSGKSAPDRPPAVQQARRSPRRPMMISGGRRQVAMYRSCRRRERIREVCGPIGGFSETLSAGMRLFEEVAARGTSRRGPLRSPRLRLPARVRGARPRARPTRGRGRSAVMEEHRGSRAEARPRLNGRRVLVARASSGVRVREARRPPRSGPSMGRRGHVPGKLRESPLAEGGPVSDQG